MNKKLTSLRWVQPYSKYKRKHRLILLWFTHIAISTNAFAQIEPRTEQYLSHTSPTTSQASAPFSECPSFLADPVANAWCFLTQASPVLQSVQIVILGLLGAAAIWRTLYVRRKRRAKLTSGNVTKEFVNVENSRLTSITDDLSNKYFVAGFSGILWKIDDSFKATVASLESVGLIRSLVHIEEHGSVLIGGDDGVLHVFDIGTSTIKRLATLGSPIYRLARASDRLFVVALGTGDVILLDVQRSPGQNDYSFQECWRIRAHSGSAFDVIPFRGGFVSVGADGQVAQISASGKITLPIKVTDCTIWSVTRVSLAPLSLVT